MNLLGLLFVLGIFIFFFWFVFKMIAHLFRVFGWIGSDLTKSVVKAASVEDKPVHEEDEAVTGADVPQRASAGGDEEPPAFTELAFLAFFHVATAVVNTLVGILDFFRRVPGAIKMPFPKRCAIWYTEFLLCFLPLVIFMRVPDVYGFKPTISAIKWGLAGFAAFIFVIYFLRALLKLDIETVFQGQQADEPDESDKDISPLIKYRHALYGILALAFCVIVLVRLTILGIFIIGFFFSLVYFLSFGKRGDPRFTIRTFLFSWLVLMIFAAIGVIIIQFGSTSTHTVADFALHITVLISFIFIYTLWLMGRKYELSRGLRELPIRSAGSWLNQFVGPFAKLAAAGVMFYFVLLFFSVNSTMFYLGLAFTALISFVRVLLRYRIPKYIPHGIFAAYLLLVWIAIFYVQSYNRIPPAQSECTAISNNSDVRPVWTMKDYSKIDYLQGALPYDTILDPSENTCFVSFKNLSGYGAVVKVDSETGELKGHVITDNDTNPGEMLYPERFCINPETHSLYSSTKSSRNFQLLVFDYSDGFDLRDRVYFPNYETTNCTIDNNTGEIYTIFLGPPDSHIRVIDPDTHDELSSIHFGRFGYADYFVLDHEKDRMVVPSLDPSNRFKIYEVTGVKEKDYRVIEHEIKFKNRLLGFIKMKLPAPTLGIAKDYSTGKFYFTVPFLRLVLETDGEDFIVGRTFKAGRFPRELAVNEKLNLLLIANYGDGTVHALDLERWKLVKEFRVGKLVRSLSVDQESGRMYAVTACGVFELLM